MNKRVFEVVVFCFTLGYPGLNKYSRTPNNFISVFQNKAKQHVFNFGWPFNRDKDNSKTFIGTAKRWLQPLNRSRGGQLIGVLFAFFFNTDNNFETLINGCLIRGDY